MDGEGDRGELLDSLRLVPLFEELADADLAEVASIVIDRRLARNDLVFREGEPVRAVHIVREGRVKVYRVGEDGREQIMCIMQAGEYFPHVGLFEEADYPANAQVLEPTRLAVIRVRDLESLIGRRPGLAIAMLKIQASMLRHLQGRVRDLALVDVRGRTARALLFLAEQSGIMTAGGMRLNLFLTRQDLANLVGTTRETVTRVLSDFRREGLFQVDDAGNLLLDSDGLRRAAGEGC